MSSSSGDCLIGVVIPAFNQARCFAISSRLWLASDSNQPWEVVLADKAARTDRWTPSRLCTIESRSGLSTLQPNGERRTRAIVVPRRPRAGLPSATATMSLDPFWLPLCGQRGKRGMIVGGRCTTSRLSTIPSN